MDIQGQLSNHRTALADLAALVAVIVARPLSEHSTPIRRFQIQHRLTGAEIDMLLKDRSSGHTIAQLATVYAIHRTTVLSHLKRARGAAIIVIH